VSPASAALSVIIDTQPATAALAHVSETTTSTGMTLTLSGTAADAIAGVAYTVSFLQDGANVGTVTPSNGAWSFTESSVSNTIHTYTLQTTDAASNTGPGADTLIVGTSGRDTIVGGSGNNLIFGGSGADTLTGGSGQNTFIYNSVSDAPYPKHAGAVETITNWATGFDHIDLSSLGHLTFGGQTQSVTPFSVEWYVSGGNTYVVGDVLGHAKPDFMIELMGVHALSSSDFHFG
jgi:Ca2+-binding RTX toxin-like protein